MFLVAFEFEFLRLNFSLELLRVRVGAVFLKWKSKCTKLSVDEDLESNLGSAETTGKFEIPSGCSRSTCSATELLSDMDGLKPRFMAKKV